jgi:hypothetical protein
MRRSRNYWTKDRCHEEALKYKTRREFQTNSKVAYSKARKMGWLDDICSHMVLIHKPPGYWIKERIIEAASECSTRTEFYVKYSTASTIARNMGWIDEICAHMEVLRDPTVKIGNRYGYIIITGITSRIRSTDNKKINSFEYLCDCGNTGSFGTTNLNKKIKQQFKTSCGCNMGGYRDTMLLNQSGFNNCFECKQTLPVSNFGKNKSSKNGLQRSCRECKSKRDKAYRNDPRFREHILNRKKEDYYTIKKDPEKYDAILKRQRETRDYSLEYITMRADPFRRSKDVIRKLILQSLRVRDISKSKIRLKTEEILGCDLNYFKEYIESQFTEGMTWLNHGQWHLDHIIPMDAAETVDEVIKLNHWTNFQPLWSNDNYSKYFYVLEEHYELFYKLLGREFDKESGRVKN